MDLNRVVQPNEPLNELHHKTMSNTMNSTQHSLTGAKIVQHSIYDGTSQPILDQMSNVQVNAATMNPDLRKKLRVDRVRKMTMGNSAALTALEDPSKPEWMKVKSLREIEIIRESKKRDIIQQLMGTESQGTCPILNVMPGHLTFTPPLSVINDTNQVQTYTVKIVDEDEAILGG